jgi:hypothetical protein
VVAKFWRRRKASSSGKNERQEEPMGKKDPTEEPRNQQENQSCELETADEGKTNTGPDLNMINTHKLKYNFFIEIQQNYN